MSKNYYETLGVAKTASDSEIKKAFYKLAGQYHPDKPEGNEAKFKEINEAYQVLSDKEKRARYDQFGSADGPQFGGQGGNPFGAGFDFNGFQNGGFEFNFGGGDMEDILSQFFGGGRRVRRGRDIEARVAITFAESVTGCERTVSVAEFRDGTRTGERSVKITIPAGVDNGASLRVTGYGESVTDGKSGDLYVHVSVAKHPVLRKEGMHLVAEVSIPVSTALLGDDTYQIEYYDGKKLKVEIPAGVQPGQILRVRGKGIHGTRGTGDLLIVISVAFPKKLSREAKKAVEILQKEGI